MRSIVTAALVIFAASSSLPAHDGPHAKPAPDAHFLYDAADHTLDHESLGFDESYDCDLASIDGELWLAWLDFVPGEGDRLLLGPRVKPGAAALLLEGRRIAKPTLTLVGDAWWLTAEVFDPETERWGIDLWKQESHKSWAKVTRLAREAGNLIDHAVAAAPGADTAWLVAQSSTDDGYQIVATRITADAEPQPWQTVSTAPSGAWSPQVAVTARHVCIAWDQFRDGRFDVVARWRDRKKDGPDHWSAEVTVAGSPAFEGHVQLASANGGVWIAWEEGGANWGQPYRGVWEEWNRITDDVGPLHRHRRLHLAHFRVDGTVHPTTPLPMPSFARAAARDARPGAERLGVFYERAQLTVDDAGHPWIAYRHYYHPQSAAKAPVKHHIESGWRVFARRLQRETWSPLFGFEEPQRDGAQRLAVTPHQGGVALAWTVGRTDRRKDPRSRGVATAKLPAMTAAGWTLPVPTESRLVTIAKHASSPQRVRETELAGRRYQLFRGDLHRHSDLSLCFPFYDGSMDDAYRYAIEAGDLDFFGLTDHARDLDQGRVNSQAWWRSTKLVTRHHHPGRFHPFYAYERSRGETDHNVISLRDDMLRPHTTPHATFFQLLDTDTFTIPHATLAPPSRAFNPVMWRTIHDTARRLAEMFQGFRDYSAESDLHEALARGHHLGFIGSSDHLSTGSSFAYVWSDRADRESIFRALQARRTFAATTAVELIFRTGDHWMGEQIVSDQPLTFHVEVRADAPLTTLALLRNGERHQLKRVDATSYVGTFEAPAVTNGEDSFYLHVAGADGLEAWASPIWVRAK